MYAYHPYTGHAYTVTYTEKRHIYNISSYSVYIEIIVDEEGLPAEAGESGHGTSSTTHASATSPSVPVRKDGLLDLHLSLGTDTEADDSGLDVELELFGSSHHQHHNHIHDDDNHHSHSHSHSHNNTNTTSNGRTHHSHRPIIEMSDDSEPELPLGRGRSHRPIASLHSSANNNKRHLRDQDGL
jgi:hypothetical protein